MAEHNFAYSRAHPTLSDLAAKSWRFSFSNFFRRAPRRTSSSLLDPVTGAHAPTGCKELDEELHEMGRAAREAQILADKAIAARLNEAEHAAADELVECECCFGDYPWEESVACADGHFFCHMCLIRSVQESVYGQGKSLLTAHCSVRCLSSTAQPPCTDSVPSDVLITVLPRELYNSLEDRTASENLEKSGLRLVRCPFCGYAEVDELQPFFIRRSATAFVLLLLLGSFETVMIPFALGGAFLLLSSLLFLPPLLLKPFTSPPWLLGPRLSNAIRAVGLRRRGSLFRCQNSRCARESCILCSKEWAPFHKCFEKEEDAARIYVERAMADAVKRTVPLPPPNLKNQYIYILILQLQCPLCHVSFVKSDGCNKLTCPCGYVMCYICRADIRDVGYKHFCQHFRLVPGTACSDCEACDLYANEDEAAAIRTAAVAAEEEYWRRNGKPKGWSWRGVGGPVAEEVGDVRWGWGVALERGSEGLDQVLERFVEWAVEFT